MLFWESIKGGFQILRSLLRGGGGGLFDTYVDFSTSFC